MLRRADAELAPKLVAVSVQKRREDIAKGAISLGAIFRARVGKFVPSE